MQGLYACWLTNATSWPCKRQDQLANRSSPKIPGSWVSILRGTARPRDGRRAKFHTGTETTLSMCMAAELSILPLVSFTLPLKHDSPYPSSVSDNPPKPNASSQLVLKLVSLYRLMPNLQLVKSPTGPTAPRSSPLASSSLEPLKK